MRWPAGRLGDFTESRSLTASRARQTAVGKKKRGTTFGMTRALMVDCGATARRIRSWSWRRSRPMRWPAGRLGDFAGSRSLASSRARQNAAGKKMRGTPFGMTRALIVDCGATARRIRSWSWRRSRPMRWLVGRLGDFAESRSLTASRARQIAAGKKKRGTTFGMTRALIVDCGATARRTRSRRRRCRYREVRGGRRG
jgi:hypothetical protein